MHWIRYIIMTIILIITLYVAYHHYLPKSKFWKYQPVPRKTMNDDQIGDIVDNPLSSKHLSLINPNQFEKIDKIDDLVKFLNNNYFEGVKYNKEYLEWELSNKGESWFLRQSGKIIGSISELPLTILINGNNKSFMYVDHLSVLKDERGKGIATKLISKGVQIGVQRDIPRFIFRIEEKPLPYPYLCKLTNFYGKIDNSKIDNSKINIDNHNYQLFNGNNDNGNININDLVYQFWKKVIEKHKFAMTMNQKQFIKYASSSNVVTTIYWMKDDQIVGLIIGLKTVFKGDPVTEIVFANCNNDQEETMISNINSLNTQWITMHNYSNHIKWIKKLKLKKSHDLYIHLYNFYNLSIKPEDLHFGCG